MARRLLRQGGDHFFLPRTGKTAAHAEIEKFEVVAARGLPAKGVEHGNLVGQAQARFAQRGGLVEAAEI